MAEYPTYDRVDALERDESGNLRIYRRRGPFGLLRRQTVFHPAGEWLTVLWHPSGRCQVATRVITQPRSDVSCRWCGGEGALLRKIPSSADPTADAGIDVGQLWRVRHTGDHFTVLRTYRDNPINPSFLIEFEPPAPGWHSRGKTAVTLGYFTAYCERAEVQDA